MTPEQKSFETKYHYKVVKPLCNHYKFVPIKEYVVISALLNWEDDGKTTIFAIKAVDYNLENKHMFTFKIASEEFDVCMNDFEVIRDGYDEYVKPIILDEVLNSWEEDGNDHWKLQYSSYMFKEKCGKVKVPKIEIKRPIVHGMDEYMFIFKSIFDLDKPNCYIVPIPNLQYRNQVEEYIKPFRDDVLNNNVVYGMNRRLMIKE